MKGHYLFLVFDRSGWIAASLPLSNVLHQSLLSFKTIFVLDGYSEMTFITNNMKLKIYIFSLIFFPTILTAQSPDYNTLFDYYLQEKNFNGVVLVASDGKIDFLKGGGLANRQNGTEITSKSKFKICSITKTFTAVLVMQLVEGGKLDLDATISKYLPWYKGEGKDKITIRHLLTYSSGLDDTDQRLDEIYVHKIPLDSMIHTYFSGPLVSEPGQKFSYKNADFIILGKIIESITGKSFEENLQEKILTPLQMQNTNMLKNEDIITGLVNGYTFDTNQRFLNEEPYFIENFYASAAMYSTIEDLLKFDQAVFRAQIVQKSTLDLMLTSNPQLYYVGIGFWISPAKFGTVESKVADRRGNIGGINTNWYHLIEQNKTILIFANTDATDLVEMREKFALISLDQPFTLPQYTKEDNETSDRDLSALKGVRTLDLRPSPSAEPYLQEFKILEVKNKDFSGTYYGSNFENGIFNTQWDKIYFGFSTSDQSSSYFHSGYIEKNKIFGVSYSMERHFIVPWSGIKK